MAPRFPACQQQPACSMAGGGSLPALWHGLCRISPCRKRLRNLDSCFGRSSKRGTDCQLQFNPSHVAGYKLGTSPIPLDAGEDKWQRAATTTTRIARQRDLLWPPQRLPVRTAKSPLGLSPRLRQRHQHLGLTCGKGSSDLTYVIQSHPQDGSKQADATITNSPREQIFTNTCLWLLLAESILQSFTPLP